MKFFSVGQEGYCNIDTGSDTCEKGACGTYAAGSEGCKIVLADDAESKYYKLKCENTDN